MADLESLLADTRYWLDQGSDPAAPSAGEPVTYTKSGQLYVRNSSGIVGPLLDETAHDSLDHTGLTGVGGGGSAPASARFVASTADYTTTSTSFVDVDGTNLALSITTGAHRVMVGLMGTCSEGAGTDTVNLTVAVDGTDQGGPNGIVRIKNSTDQSNASFVYLTDTLTAASHTFKLRWKTTGGTATLVANSALHLVFWVVEVA